MIIAIDYDMTIADQAGNLIEGAKENISKLKDDGHFIILWTSRTGESLDEAVKTLTDNSIAFDIVNENKPGIPNDPRKVIADIYIDDKNVGGLADWNTIYEIISGGNKPTSRNMKTNQIELRSIDIRAVENRTVEFVISDGSVDAHGTILNPGGWDLTRFSKNGIFGYQHNLYSPEINPDYVLGPATAYVSDSQLIGRATFETEDINPLAEKIFRKVKNGTLKAVSVGFTSKKQRRREDGVIILEELELLEFSIVNIPSNPNATVKRNFKKSLKRKHNIFNYL